MTLAVLKRGKNRVDPFGQYGVSEPEVRKLGDNHRGVGVIVEVFWPLIRVFDVIPHVQFLRLNRHHCGHEFQGDLCRRREIKPEAVVKKLQPSNRKCQYLGS